MKNQYEEDWEYLGLLPKPTNPKEMAEKWESEVFGDRDGEGKRYWIPALYLLADDSDNALMYFYRFELSYLEEAINSCPEYLMCSLLAYIRQHGNLSFNSDGGFIMRRLYASNPYLIELIFELVPKPKDYWHPTNLHTLEYAMHLPQWTYDLWNEEDKSILKGAFKSTEFKSFTEVDDKLWKDATSHPTGHDRTEGLLRHKNYRDVMLVKKDT